MFENLSERLGGVFDRLTKQGALSEDDVKTALREVRVALLEADVSLPVARDFIKAVQAKATGQAVTKSVTPGQQVVKIVHDELKHILTGDEDPGALKIDNPPAPILMVGLQGGGKTTTTAKLAKRLKEKDGKRVLMASLDVNRPAAMEQLAILGVQIGVDTLPIVKGEDPVAIAKRAKTQAGLGGYDVYMLDTAGRLSIDEELMSQVEAVRDVANPRETLLVVDGLTGQDAVHTAENFDERIGISGVVLTRMDGDGRGGASLSMRAVTGKPIKLLGVGEKMDALEDFYPKRIADRILGMGDIVSLVEKASETIDAEQAQAMAKKMQKGLFDMDDLSQQLGQMSKMGGMGSIMKMMPGIGKMAKQIEQAGIDDSVFKRQQAIISSMTRKERKAPKLLNASRKKRIAAGSGSSVQEVNQLLKMHRQMADMMKKMSGKGGAGLMGKMAGAMGMPMPGAGADMGDAMRGLGGAAPNMDPEALEDMARNMGGGLGGGMGGMPKLPGLGGGSPFAGKKK